jgi:EpsI family protein
MKMIMLISAKVPRQLVLNLYIAVGLICLTFALLQRFPSILLSPPAPKLQELPFHIGAWHGTEDTLEQNVVTFLKLDDYTLRTYQRDSGTFVWLYIGYYATRLRFSKHHSPLICYPANGWEIMEKNLQSINLLSGSTIRVHKLLVQKGSHKRLVLYWHQWGDQVSTEEESWLTRVLRVFKEYQLKVDTALETKKLRIDKALVRIDAPILHSIDTTLSHEIDFIQSAFPLLVTGVWRIL